MPRPKIHKTKKQRLEAEREKVSRYYKCNADTIKMKKRIGRAERSMKEKKEDAQRRIQRCNEQEQVMDLCLKSNLAESRIVRDYDNPIWRLRQIHTGLDRLLNSPGTDYMESVYQDFVEYLSSGGSPTAIESPTSVPEATINSMYEAARKERARFLCDHGLGSEIVREAELLVKRRRHVGQCVTDLVLHALKGDLHHRHAQRELPYQTEAEEKWLNQNFIDEDTLM
ncbi:hypothetical protein PQX77_021605 [Marasmius sp. AFHP31]|nr:hypothetical protein PQX77_021605 [Marasmius sp. AFHP31]